MLVFGIVIIIGAWQVYDNYYIFHNTHDNDVLKYKPDPNDPDKQKNSPISKDMVAWLTIDNTNIDYPVMQAKDNTKYMNTDPFGNYSLSGSIFLDSRSSSDFSDFYSVIYGHHMSYGRMFGSLDDFLNESYLKAHTTGSLMVGRNAQKVYKLRVFAAMRVSARNRIVFDMSEKEIADYIHKHAQVLTEEEDRRIIALSTCTDANSIKRIVVFCYIL